jgi:tRNA threonylcarbamoyladenosine biosynthesis protein TsaE
MRIISKSEDQTKELARRLAKGLLANDCLALVGPFGGGKTVFVKGLAEGFGVKKKSYVSSPSFVILKIYSGVLPLYHFDLYRLSCLRDFEDMGFDEFLANGGVSVIEWADKFMDSLPEHVLNIHFTVLEGGLRRITFSTKAPRIKRLVQRLLKDA